MKKYFYTILLVLLGLSDVYAGGWTKKKGTGFIKLNQFFIFSDEFLNPEGNVVRPLIPTNSLFITSLYAEYGITDKLTVNGYFPFYSRSVLNELRSLSTGEIITPGDELNSIGDSFIGIKYGFFQGENDPVKISVGLEFGLAIGEDSGGDTQLLQTGDGEYNQRITVEASRSFYPIPLYTSVLIGFNNRTRDFSEEFHFSFESGYSWTQKFNTSVRLSVVESFKNGSSTPGGNNGIFSNNSEFFTIRPGASYKFTDNFGLEVGAIFLVRGEQTLGDPGYEAGLFYEF